MQKVTNLHEMTVIIRSLGSEVVGIGCIVDKSFGKLQFDTPFVALLPVEVTHFTHRDSPMCNGDVARVPNS